MEHDLLLPSIGGKVDAGFEVVRSRFFCAPLDMINGFIVLVVVAVTRCLNFIFLQYLLVYLVVVFFDESNSVLSGILIVFGVDNSNDGLPKSISTCGHCKSEAIVSVSRPSQSGQETQPSAR